MSSKDVVHHGSCHCGAVKWTLHAPEILECIKCNCSICRKKSNDHYIVTKDRFTLLQGEEQLTTYTFNTHQAKHRFCSICGVQSFYMPRSNPDCIGTLSPNLVSKFAKSDEIRPFEGVYL
ncbi:hypothetical protein Y032_0631g858 [Ancylostoma ceylanicum]|uniref:CENP-V/GFA domain-containing protein n=1 Tax=Ancylostoma ceylanicum TaxID=53326 RepID=A0A016WM37_9BILA|nr:hypothetical protein Y032_0631g858 [Ancylostoma ceylanicum]